MTQHGGLAQAPLVPFTRTPSNLLAQVQERFKKMSPEDKEKVNRILTPDLADMIGTLIDPEVGQLIGRLANPNNVLRAVPRQALDFMGEEKFQKFFESAMLKAQEAMELEAQTRVESRPQGLAAPQVPFERTPENIINFAQQQAPVSPPAPTGLAGRPQLPLPSSSNPVPNQPIQ